MISVGLAGKNDLVKILGNGELTAKLDVTANAFSASAIKKLRTQVELLIRSDHYEKVFRQ